jgi:hypothetical protein
VRVLWGRDEQRAGEAVLAVLSSAGVAGGKQAGVVSDSWEARVTSAEMDRLLELRRELNKRMESWASDPDVEGALWLVRRALDGPGDVPLALREASAVLAALEARESKPKELPVRLISKLEYEALMDSPSKLLTKEEYDRLMMEAHR